MAVDKSDASETEASAKLQARDAKGRMPRTAADDERTQIFKVACTDL
jgi:hypothetical protein